MTRRFWLTALAVVTLDQWSKLLVVQWLPALHESRAVLPDILNITHVQNTGIAFGLFRERGWSLIALAILAATGIIWYWSRLQRRHELVGWPLTLALSLPLGGALGNLLDRVRLGHVIDFIDVGWWPVFNLADAAITIGAALFAWYCIASREHPHAQGAASVPPSATR